MTEQLQKKVDFAIRLLRSIPQDSPIEVSYSGGKDSDVILELAKMSGIPYRAIYKNTTIDPPGTIKHCKSKGVEIFAPKIRFFDLVKQEGSPTRWTRFCCKHLKEYKVLDRAVQGIRRSESKKREERYKEPEVCRVYNKDEKVKVYLPILEWTDEDVVEFIAERGIKCHPLYYDEQGNFHVERRLGCLICPLMSQRKLREAYKQYPKMLKLMISAYQDFFNNNPDIKAHKRFRNAYEERFFALFCTNMNEFKALTSGGLFPETAIDAKAFMEDYFKIDLTI
ncbi:MAG: phosphoadenosine phosphosulfate reductase family protein [Bacteroidales bacterium]|nr:phosphoadenosine phosphosulfate reductase family protein [Bacteroidales bacterium]